MASSSTFAVILVFVALGGVLAAEAAGRPSGSGSGTLQQGWIGANNNNIDIDNDDISRQRLSMPVSDHLMVSPLDADRTAKYLRLINDNTLGAHSTEFCQEAKLQCSADIAIVDPTLRISRSSLLAADLFQQTRDLMDATRAMQFSGKDIQKDAEIMVPQTLGNSYPAVSFLPQSLAEKLPFTSAKMPELFEKLSIPEGSNLAIMMSRTVGQCEAQEQGKTVRKCVTSLEDMKTFVSANLPQDKRIVALERSSSIPGAGESHSKDSSSSSNSHRHSYKVLDSKLYDRAVVCRNSVFPYAVFECHDTSKTNMHVYQVEMQSRTDGSHIKELAACHDTDSVRAAAMAADSTISADTAASAAPAAQACHWVTDSLIWAPAS